MSDAQSVLPSNALPMRRRFRQFGIRTLLMLMLLAAVGFGCIAFFVIRPVRLREAAARKITDSGGLISYRHESDLSISEPQPPGPAWLRWLVGDQMFLEADVIYLVKESPAQQPFDWSAVSAFPEARRVLATNVPLDAEGVHHLAKLTELSLLQLENAGVTDDLLSAFDQHEHLNMVMLPKNPIRGHGFAAWKPLKTITRTNGIDAASLDLSSTELDDAGLKCLAHQTELVFLDLKKTRVSNLAPLAGLTKLWTLDVSDTQVNDAGLESLSNLAELEDLRLQGTKIMGGGLEHLNRLPELKFLDLSGTRIRSNELSPLAELPKLGVLRLNSLPIGDDDLDLIVRCPKLVQVGLTDTNVTERGLERLKQLPRLSVELNELDMRRPALNRGDE